MQTENNILGDLKHTFKSGGMTMKLIFINVGVFILIGILEVIAKMLSGNLGAGLINVIHSVFALHTDFSSFIIRPWGLFTNIFTHFGIIHLLFNMIFLYSVGRMFEQFFSAKRLLYTYLLGGLAGGILELLIHLLPFNASGSLLIGASGSVMAILVATAFYKPQLTVSIWGLFNMRLIYLALIFILLNLYNAGMGIDDGTAYFAHLGGALLGYFSVQNPFAATNVINRGMVIGDKLVAFAQKRKTSKSTFKYTKSKKTQASPRFKTDEEYNQDAKARQEKIDKILDKISKSGYESLTKEEKAFLFQQSNS